MSRGATGPGKDLIKAVQTGEKTMMICNELAPERRAKQGRKDQVTPTDDPLNDWRQFARKAKAHPLAEIFPLLDEASKDFEELASSISVHGVLEPIVLMRDLRILDGRNRLRALMSVQNQLPEEYAPQFVFFEDLPIDHELIDEHHWVAAKNLHRRHLTNDQKAVAAAAIYHGYRDKANESRSAKAIGNKNAEKNSGGQTSPTKPATRTREKVQEAAGVSERQARAALMVQEENPELAKQVIGGAVTLNEAAKQVKAKRSPTKKEKAKESDVKTVEHCVAKVLTLIARFHREVDPKDKNRLITEILSAIDGRY